MLTPDELKLLTANQRFISQELMCRGITVDVFDWENEILDVTYGAHRELLQDVDGAIMPYASSIIASSKFLAKRLLQERGVSVPKGFRVLSTDIDDAMERCTKLSFPLVVKPGVGVQGQLVFTDISTPGEVALACNTISLEKGSVEVLIEEQFLGDEYRVFMTREGQYAALKRDPAHVYGDGFHTIDELIRIENKRRTPRQNCLCEIILNEDAERFLRKQCLTLSSIPQSGEKVYLRCASNVKLGGVPIDVTEIVHSSVVEICRNVLAAIPGLPYAGIDFMTTAIDKAQDSYVVLEVNSVPGIGIHMAPGVGKPRNVASMIVDLLFPETKIALKRAA